MYNLKADVEEDQDALKHFIREINQARNDYMFTTEAFLDDVCFTVMNMVFSVETVAKCSLSVEAERPDWFAVWLARKTIWEEGKSNGICAVCSKAVTTYPSGQSMMEKSRA